MIAAMMATVDPGEEVVVFEAVLRELRTRCDFVRREASLRFPARS